MSSRGWGGFAPYVPVAQRRRQAEKVRDAMAKKGFKFEPVTVAGRTIARTWWGTAWAQNLERYADYSNRMPRGRTYVRNGSVIDLKILPNAVTALVSGRDAHPYKIKVGIKSLDKKVVDALIQRSRASLDSMQMLLSGEFPPDLKDEFFKQGSGLFPAPKEISLDCSCPDWADMCKHVAAALYGVAARLDDKPELFFVLRGIKIEDFVGKMVKDASKSMLKKAKGASTRAISSDSDDISALFGIDMESTGGGDKNPASKKAPKAGGAIAKSRPVKNAKAVQKEKPGAAGVKKGVEKKKGTAKKKVLKKAGVKGKRGK